jgi:hypothetical protein
MMKTIETMKTGSTTEMGSVEQLLAFFSFERTAHGTLLSRSVVSTLGVGPFAVHPIQRSCISVDRCAACYNKRKIALGSSLPF